MVDLLSLLTRKLGSPRLSKELLERNRESLGVNCLPTEPGLVAMSLCSLGVTTEEVSSLLSWKEFESFCANLLRAAGYEVREDVQLRKPRAQIDLVAFGPSLVLSVDCKHWKKEASASPLAKVAQDQHRRNAQLKKALSGSKPIVSVILMLSHQGERFVGGAAVVPLHTLRSFLGSVEGYLDLMIST
jgi:Holliday junction resolvase-like predicted endonuclease